MDYNVKGTNATLLLMVYQCKLERAKALVAYIAANNTKARGIRVTILSEHSVIRQAN